MIGLRQHNGTTTSGEEFSVIVFKPSTAIRPATRTTRESFISKKSANPSTNGELKNRRKTR
jgi:hypothetical protein